MNKFFYPLLIVPFIVAFKGDALPTQNPNEFDSKVKIVYEGGDGPTDLGAKKAQQVLRNKKFYAGIRKQKDFDFTNANGELIASELEKATFTVRVRGYHGGDDTKTLAYVTSELPTTVFINTSKNDNQDNRTPTDIANTIIHETIHILDRATPEARFGHGGNSANGKRKSAPYWIGAFAEQLLSGGVKDLQAVNAFLDDSAPLVIPDQYFIHVEETESIENKMIDFTPPASSPNVLGSSPANKSAVKKAK
jgi:hypothetical protein